MAILSVSDLSMRLCEALGINSPCGISRLVIDLSGSGAFVVVERPLTVPMANSLGETIENAMEHYTLHAVSGEKS